MPGLYPLDTSGTPDPQVVTTKNVSIDIAKCVLWGKISPSKTTGPGKTIPLEHINGSISILLGRKHFT